MTPDTEVIVRRAAPCDADALVRFNRAMARETEGRELAQAVVSAGVRSVFDDPGKGFYIVAEAGGTPAGSLLVTREWSDWRNGYYWWIQSVYVVPERRGKGIYRLLHRRVEELARSEGNVCGLRLYVDSGNSAAKAVYGKMGMQKSRYDLFESARLMALDPDEND
jgi:GNAT superfamily N-acetyltransferase